MHTSFRRLSISSLIGMLFLVLFLAVSFGTALSSEPASRASQPKLAVLVIFDQLRGDYLTRWDSLFTKGGFHRLEQDGAWFQNCHYPYAYTVTGAGHASVATGCSPAQHGIVGNEWYDRSAAATIPCVFSERYEPVPPRGRGKTVSKDSSRKAKGISPEQLLAPTLGDALKEATGGRGQIVSLSFKERSAVLPGGKGANACYWLDTSTGQFSTSTYYRDRLHPWVDAFNRKHPADHWFKTSWMRLRPDLDYDRYSGPDDVRAEGMFGLSRTFPHALDGGKLGIKSIYYNTLFNSPFGNQLLLDLVRCAIDAEHLGQREVADLLCISFSSNDAIGHCWGPDSQEVLDVTLRSDLIVRDLLDFLDAKVGKQQYILVLTADHGVCPLPEVAKQQGHEAGRLSGGRLLTEAHAFLDQRFGDPAHPTRWIEATAPSWIYLNRQVLKQHKLASSVVEDALAGWLAKQPGIQSAYTRTQLSQEGSSLDEIGRMVRRSFHSARCGDVAVVLKPYYLIWPEMTGTTHGTPHSYDTHVPLLVYGPDIRPGVRKERVTPLATARILARALGIRPPARADAAIPKRLFLH